LDRDGDAVVRGRLALARAVVFHLKGKEKEALGSLDLARGLSGKDDFRLACVEAEVRSNSNDVEQAQAGYVKCQEMLNGCRARGDSSGVLVCAMRMGYLEGTTGGHEDALKYYTEALQIVRAWGDTSRMGVALRNIGLANRKLRQYPESEAAYREALDLARAAGNRGLAAGILNDLSMLYAEMGDEARAEATDREAEEALRSIADDLRQGKLRDTVLLDFYQGVKVRFANLLPYNTDLFAGFCDQLALEPPR
jgi:tetratricopeptide (TPR) repeat protein